MTSRPAIVLSALAAFLLDLSSGGIGSASAQIGPSQFPTPGATEPAKQPEGVAEAAEDTEKLPTTPVLPPIKSKRKRFELFELDGYFRFRTNWYKDFNLGFDNQGPGGAPFSRPLTCPPQGTEGVSRPCGDTLKSANMRLRVEPTVNITETSHVHAQIDVLDNVVLGDNANPGALPLRGDTDGQQPPSSDGYLNGGIRIKQAWAEIETSLGQITFGRQPWHWGLGILANSGGADPFTGTYNLDSNFGDSVDRLMFRTQIPGTDLTAALATDWSSVSPTLSWPSASATGGEPVDWEDSDDVSQWVVMLSRFDSPKEFEERVARGELAFNYGAMLIYRTQDWDYQESDDPEVQPWEGYVRRGLKSYTPDAWLRLGKGKLSVQLEALFNIGSIDSVIDIDPAQDEGMDLRRFGGVARVGYRTLEDAMGLGLELGYASGDQWDNPTPGVPHVGNGRTLPGAGDTTISKLVFDPDYHVDLILFRELLGAVNNATYVKPSLSYRVTEDIEARFAGILSFANVPVATPGNGTMYGVELDADLGYHSGGFFFGLSAGALFPLGAMHHPADDGTGPGFGFQDEDQDNTGTADNAYTIQSRLMLQF